MYQILEDLTRAEYEAVLRQDFAAFAARYFHELNPRTELGINSFSEGWAQFTFYRLSSYFSVNTPYYA